MHPQLRLTEEEKRYNDYYDSPGKRGVIERTYSYSVQLLSTNPQPLVVHTTSRRSRVFQLTFSGYYQGAKVQVKTATGELFINDPLHIPLLVGGAPRDPNSRNPGLIPAQMPRPELGQGNAAKSRALTWPYLFEPNIVLPGSRELQIQFSPARPNDPILSQGGYVVGVTVWVWEFPGFQGGAI